MSLEDRFRNKWTLMPTKNDINQLGHMSHYRGTHGRELEESGCVEDAHIIEKTFYAVVNDGIGKNHVEMTQDDGKLECWCNCMVFDMHTGCQHVVAALVHLQKNFKRLVHEAEQRKSSIDSMVAAANPEDVAKFLSRAMLVDEDLHKEFMDDLNLQKGDVEEDPRFDMDLTYYMGLKNGKVEDNLDFSGHFKDGLESEPAKSIELHRAMSESILENMERVDNSDGYYTDCIIESLENMAEAVLKMPSRDEHIKYMAGALAKAPPELAGHYRDALLSVCTTDGDKKCLRDTLGKITAETPVSEHTVGLVLLQMRLLEDAGDEDGLLRLLDKSYYKDAALRTKYIGMLGKSGSLDGVRRVLNDFPQDAETVKAALAVWDPADPEYLRLLKDAFASTVDWKYYTKIKRATKDWKPQGLIDEMLKKRNAGAAAEICMRERMYGAAMDTLESAKNMELFKKYARRLGKRYPSRYFAAYSSLIRQTAKKSKPSHYETIRDHASRLKALDAGRYPEFLRALKSENPKKRFWN